MAPKLKGGLKLDIAPDSAAAGGTINGGGGGNAEIIDPFEGIPQGDIKFRDKDFEYIHELGSGSGGSVAKVRHKATGKIMAKKNILIIVDAEANRKKAEKQLKTELKLAHIIRSDYIVSSYGAYSHEGDVCIVMEYMDRGSLDYIYKTNGAVPEHIAAKIAVHVLRGLEYLTEQNVVHRDIKPSNILVNSHGQVKIADFGVSKETISSLAKTFTGTPSYLAPERIEAGSDYSVVSDVWSLGLALIEICTARPPYGPMEECGIFDLIDVIRAQPAPTLPAGKFSEEFEGFVAECVIKDFEKRPGPEILLKHPCCAAAIESGISVAEWASNLKSKDDS